MDDFEKDKWEIRRGDIYYVSRFGIQTGSEQQTGRPAVVVSNDTNNSNSGTVEICYCTTQQKRCLPTHVTICGTSRVSTVLCEQITTVSTDRLGKYIAQCTPEEMEQIDQALLVSLDLDNYSDPQEQIRQDNAEEDNTIAELRTEIDILKTQRDIYKELYETMLAQVLSGAKRSV